GMSERHAHPLVAHDGTDAEARPEPVVERNDLAAWSGVIAPVAVGVLMLGLWEALVRLKGIPDYILPGPLVIARTLITDWSALSSPSLWREPAATAPASPTAFSSLGTSCASRACSRRSC